VRVATWNVNSLGRRLERVEQWLGYAAPDVLLLQETKLRDSAFPAERFAALGYEGVHFGTGGWNGVAVLTRLGVDEVRRGLGEVEPTGDEEVDGVMAEPRALIVSSGGIWFASVYVPNGRSLESFHYRAKLRWLERLTEVASELAADGVPVVLGGDFNVAPTDDDVFDPAALEGMTHVSPPERAALRRLEAAGFSDAFRLVRPEPGLFTWWDYRRGDFHAGRGMRIDLVWVSASLAPRVTWALIDREARKGPSPSDHAPVLVDIDVANRPVGVEDGSEAKDMEVPGGE
jgi:exodeoxyribonuclease-3